MKVSRERLRVAWAWGIALMALPLLGGCQYSGAFKSAIDTKHPALKDYAQHNLAAHKGEVKRLHGQIDQETTTRLIQEGYILLGYSEFVVAESNDPRHAKPFVEDPQGYAGQLGACLVVTDSRIKQVTRYATSYTRRAQYWGRPLRAPALGVNVLDLSAEDIKALGSEDGVKVLACVNDSPAAKAEIQADDFIVGMNGQMVEDVAQLEKLIKQNAGRVATFRIQRGEALRDVTVRLNADRDTVAAPAPGGGGS